MACEGCAFCGEDGTPWSEIKGHLCYDCHILSNLKRRHYEPEELIEYRESKL